MNIIHSLPLVLQIGIYGIVSILLLLAVLFVIVLIILGTYKDPWHKKLYSAGIRESSKQVGGVTFNYAEGPDNGPALLLLHAQHMDWYSYSRVLSQLSTKFHVFAVDYPGHGKTKYASDHPMNANQIGNDLAAFIESVIQKPAFVTGNSSGGLLTAWLAANRPDLVKAIVLEDPPLFSSEYPRVKETAAYHSFTASYHYMQDHAKDYLLYWLDSNSAFLEKNVGKLALPTMKASIILYRKLNPGKAVELFFLPEIVRSMIRGLEYFDARFGAGFYDGSWNEGFDHAEAIKKISCPTLLIHAHFELLQNGELYGAMDQQEAERVTSLIPDCKYLKLDVNHVIHIDAAQKFIEILEEFFPGG